MFVCAWCWRHHLLLVARHPPHTGLHGFEVHISQGGATGTTGVCKYVCVCVLYKYGELVVKACCFYVYNTFVCSCVHARIYTFDHLADRCLKCYVQFKQTNQQVPKENRVPRGGAPLNLRNVSLRTGE